ncbi:hypothetical protein HN385_00100 [archaeon]|jgi:presenilin-like A22 family membrane protease|nr:hypothetical protein [archaeon]MBT6869028.1 hypothetical protein [archaeon]MBT7193616.1 hypothetical protein [archaeon]MBT7380149.1 hypothetical protein [archaeon]MBT7507467.1 hypothetical protein [archaeon]
MKHNQTITFLLLGLFLVTQLLGLVILNEYINYEQTELEGMLVMNALPIGESPDFEQNSSYIPILLMVFLGTAIFFLVIKFKLFIFWKFAFLMASILAISASIGAFFNQAISIIVATILGVWKIFKSNPIVHNVTEILIYPGIAVILIPVFNLTSISILLVAISIYDAYAVWQSKHMVKMAKAQSKMNLFAGIAIPYIRSEDKKKGKSVVKHTSEIHDKKVPVKTSTAILGGGDIAFPLMFTGVVMIDFGMKLSLLVSLATTLSLYILFRLAKKDKYYPAMPFVSAGCFVGLGLVWLVGMFI